MMIGRKVIPPWPLPDAVFHTELKRAVYSAGRTASPCAGAAFGHHDRGHSHH